jgi:ribonuclease HI
MNIIFTDGSSRGNPGPGGWGVIVATADSVSEYGGREDLTTNNRMELMAVIMGFEYTHPDIPLTVYTDSAYVVSGMTRWVFGWRKNNWKTSAKQDVLNIDLWQRLVNLSTRRTIEWRLLKGHSGVPGNERCDVIATSYADNAPVVLYTGSRSRYGVDLAVSHVPTLKAKSKNRAKPYSYVSQVGGIIKIHKTWDECLAHVKGVSGALYKKSVSQEDEDSIISEFKQKNK